MAILQLSRITHRKGLSENLPQLAGAELGWVLDERKLFIGNGTLVDGAPVIGNTEILTEYSDILSLSSTYTYKGTAAGYVVTTGDGTDIVRSLQSKFDEVASVKDFGAKGDGQTDDTDAINRALFELFCEPGASNSSTNEAARRALFFPAGVYKVSGTIKIPPHAKLFGDGLSSSIIKFISDVHVTANSLQAGTRYAIETIGSTDFTAIGSTSNTVNEIFVATAAGTGTGTARVVTETVVETADSDQLTGLNMGTGATGELPTGIEMSSMAIHSEEDNTLLKLDSVTSSGFNYLGFVGPNTDPTLTDPIWSVNPATSAIEIDTSVGVTHDVTISKLTTYGTSYGVRAAGDIKGVVLENSGLDYHFKGVYITNTLVAATAIVPGTRYKIVAVNDTDFTLLGADYNREGVTFTANATIPLGIGTVVSMDQPGPTGVVVSRNIFDNIAYEGVHFQNTLFNSSGYNVFYNVANNMGTTAVAPVVHLETDLCVSVGDLFEREDESVWSRIALNGNGGISIDGTHSIHLGAYERQTGIEATLAAATVAETVFVFDESAVNSYRIDYNITRNVLGSDETRMGRLYVSNNGTSVTYNDEYTESTATGITLAVVSPLTDTTTELQFTADAGNDATMRYSIVRLD